MGAPAIAFGMTDIFPRDAAWRTECIRRCDGAPAREAIVNAGSWLGVLVCDNARWTGTGIPNQATPVDDLVAHLKTALPEEVAAAVQAWNAFRAEVRQILQWDLPEGRFLIDFDFD